MLTRRRPACWRQRHPVPTRSDPAGSTRTCRHPRPGPGGSAAAGPGLDPAGRQGTPADVASAALFLATDESALHRRALHPAGGLFTG
jgi:NAD(P)-dependent dehydrogenase (short-subunit alcohol dehydrogenase family)